MRRQLTLGICALCGGITCCPNRLEAEETSSITTFKNFISNPPRIENLIFEERRFGGSQSLNPNDRNGQLPTNSKFHQLRWQRDAFFLRQLADPGDASTLKAHGRFVLRLGIKYWDLDTGKRAIYWQAPSPDSNEENLVSGLVSWRMKEMGEILNFGVVNMGIGSIRWTGNDFQSDTFVPDVTVTGHLRGNSDGRPEELELIYNHLGAEVRYIVRYGYEGQLPIPHLPNVFRTYQQKDGKERPWSEVRIHECLVKRSPLDPRLFDGEQYVQANRSQVIIYTNRVLLASTPTGLVRYSKDVRAFNAGRWERYRPWFRPTLYSGFALINLTAFILLLRMKKMQRSKKQQT